MQRFAWGAIICILLAGQAAPSEALDLHRTRAEALQPKPALRLSEAQRQEVVRTVDAKATDDKPPADFQPKVDAKVPSQKKMPLHPLPQPLVDQIPMLKQYYYAKLPNDILIVDPMTRKVVVVIAR